MNIEEMLGNELYAKVQEKLGDKKIVVNDGNFIPKGKFDEVIGVKNELKSQVSELTSQLEGLKKSAEGNDSLIKQIEDLQGQNKSWEERYKKTQLETAIKLEAVKSNANDPSDILRLMDFNSLELSDDGSVKGLEDQINGLKESKAYLFAQEKQQIGKMNAPNPNSAQQKSGREALIEAYNNAATNKDVFSMMSLQKQIKNYK